MKNLVHRNLESEECSSRLSEEILSIKLIMEEFANIEYQFFLEKNEKTDAAPEKSLLEIGQDKNQKSAA